MKNWTAQESSHIYWLVVYGVSGLEIAALLSKDILPQRTWDSVRSQTVEVRKFINQVKGQKLKHPISDRSYKLLREATKISPIPEILAYKKDELGVVKPIQEHKPKIDIDRFPSEKKTELELPVEDNNISIVSIQEPTVLDVMRLAKELGAKEVEYKDMKITY